MLAWLEARRITFERAREIAQAEFACASDHQRHELSRGDL
jgi:hypothetical protein